MQVPITFKGFSDSQLQKYKDDSDISFTGNSEGKLLVYTIEKIVDLAIGGTIALYVDGKKKANIEKGTPQLVIKKMYGDIITGGQVNKVEVQKD